MTPAYSAPIICLSKLESNRIRKRTIASACGGSRSRCRLKPWQGFAEDGKRGLKVRPIAREFARRAPRRTVRGRAEPGIRNFKVSQGVEPCCPRFEASG